MRWHHLLRPDETVRTDQSWIDDLLCLLSDFRLCKVWGMHSDDLIPSCERGRGGTAIGSVFSMSTCWELFSTSTCWEPPNRARNFRNPIDFLGRVQGMGSTTRRPLAFTRPPAPIRDHAYDKRSSSLGLRPPVSDGGRLYRVLNAGR